jgi:hypothetical protein
MHSSPDGEMARFMAWRLRFKRAIEAIDPQAVPVIWREHVRVYQEAWRRAHEEMHIDPRFAAREAVREWVRASVH